MGKKFADVRSRAEMLIKKASTPPYDPLAEEVAKDLLDVLDEIERAVDD